MEFGEHSGLRRILIHAIGPGHALPIFVLGWLALWAEASDTSRAFLAGASASSHSETISCDYSSVINCGIELCVLRCSASPSWPDLPLERGWRSFCTARNPERHVEYVRRR